MSIAINGFSYDFKTEIKKEVDRISNDLSFQKSVLRGLTQVGKSKKGEQVPKLLLSASAEMLENVLSNYHKELTRIQST